MKLLAAAKFVEPNNRSWRRRLDDRRSLRSARHSDLNPCPLNTTSLRSRTSSDDATRCRYILQAIRYLHRTGFFFPSPAGTLSNLPSTNTTFAPPATSLPLPFPSPATTSPPNPSSKILFQTRLLNPCGALVTNLLRVP